MLEVLTRGSWRRHSRGVSRTSEKKSSNRIKVDKMMTKVLLGLEPF